MEFIHISQIIMIEIDFRLAWFKQIDVIDPNLFNVFQTKTLDYRVWIQQSYLV